MQEDKLTNALIEGEKAQGVSTQEYFPEAHYHHYGNRGSVDLYIYSEQSPEVPYSSTAPTSGKLFEIKSESAVRHSTGANEIIRQYNSMREFFYYGSDHDVPNKIRFELCFLPTKYNMSHIKENQSMYRESVKREIFPIEDPDNEVGGAYTAERGGNMEPDELSTKSCVTIRAPNKDHIKPIVVFSPYKDHIDEPPLVDCFSEHVERVSPYLYEEYREAIAELDK